MLFHIHSGDRGNILQTENIVFVKDMLLSLWQKHFTAIVIILVIATILKVLTI